MVLPTVLSVLAGWALLAVLAVGLFLVMRRLQAVRASLERIAMGVRAIERQAEPLNGHVENTFGRLEETADALEAARAPLGRAPGRP